MKCLIAIFVLAALVLQGCGGKAKEESKVTCFTEMTADQKAQLVEYTKQSPVSETSRENGTQDVCVMEPDNREHHYKSNDTFSDYLLYSMLLGRSNSLLIYGLISGDLDAGDYLMLSMLTGVHNDGSMYRPYSRLDDGRWERRETRLDRRVEYVQYGQRSPDRFRPGARPKPPSGYKSAPIRKVASNKQAVVSKTSGQRTVNTAKAPSKSSGTPSNKAPTKAPSAPSKSPTRSPSPAPKAPAPAPRAPTGRK